MSAANMPAADSCCGNCLWAELEPGQRLGSCHRHAPWPSVVLTHDHSPRQIIWPPITASEFCGDWRPR